MMKTGDKVKMKKDYGVYKKGDIVTINAVDKKSNCPYYIAPYWCPENIVEVV